MKHRESKIKNITVEKIIEELKKYPKNTKILLPIYGFDSDSSDVHFEYCEYRRELEIVGMFKD